MVVTDSATGASETFAELSTRCPPSRLRGDGRAVGTCDREACRTPRLSAADARPKPGTYPLTAGAEDDRAAAWAQLQNDPTAQLDRLRPFGEISLVSVPGAVDAGTQQAVVTHCESTFSRFAVLDAAPGLDPDGARAHSPRCARRRASRALVLPVDHACATRRTGTRSSGPPPSGHVTGASTRRPTAPAACTRHPRTSGRGALGVERRLTDIDQGSAQPRRASTSLRVFPGQAQPVVWGARTTAGRPRPQLAVRQHPPAVPVPGAVDPERAFAGRSSSPTTSRSGRSSSARSAEFLTPGLARRRAVRRHRGGRLLRAHRRGAQPAVDARARASSYIEVGVQPAYPAEFLVLRIGIWQGGSSVNEQ